MNSIFALAAAAASASALTVEESHIGRFNNWKALHGKEYASIEEEEARFEVFMDNHNMIEAHNAKGESFTMAHNEFSDMTPEEFKSQMNGFRPRVSQNTGATSTHAISGETPATKDWRDENVVTPVKNQGQCGSCWAFSTTGSVEAANLVKNGGSNTDAKNILSEQELVDCSHEGGNAGCQGGLMDNGFQFLIKQGATGDDTEGSYPYQAKNGQCRKSNGTPSNIQVTGFTDVNPTEEDLKNAVGTVGPVSIAIEADQLVFQFYSSGVIRSGCGDQLDHGVLLVGYTDDAWIVKNSWGADWGEMGYVRIEMGKNLCGIQNSASYPTVA